MALIYLVRKKKFKVIDGVKELYYAVQRKLQTKGGKTEEDIADIMAARKACSKGDVLSILADLPGVIETILKSGESVTIRGLGSFQTAITSESGEYPDDVMPHMVRLSKVYFIADRKFTFRVGQMKFFRYPLTKYFPKSALRPETIKAEAEQEKRQFDVTTEEQIREDEKNMYE